MFFYLVFRRDDFEVAYFTNGKFNYPLISESLFIEYKKFNLSQAGIIEAINFYASFMIELKKLIKKLEQVDINDFILTLPSLKTGYLNLLSGITEKFKSSPIKIYRSITPSSALALAKANEYLSNYLYSQYVFLSIVYDADVVEVGVYDFEDYILIASLKIIIPNIKEDHIVDDYLNFIEEKIENSELCINEIISCGDSSANPNFINKIAQRLEVTRINDDYQWPSIMEGLMLQGRMFQNIQSEKVMLIDCTVNAIKLVLDGRDKEIVFDYGENFPKVVSIKFNSEQDKVGQISLVEVNHRFTETILRYIPTKDFKKLEVSIDANSGLRFSLDDKFAYLNGLDLFFPNSSS